jgi:hypothetical protein
MANRLLLKPFFCLLVAIVLGFLVTGSDAEDRVLIKKGDFFPEVSMAAHLNKKDKEYLGISGNGSFSIKDIHAKIILVEIMNVYCSGCQNQAEVYNKLFALIQSDRTLKNDIKMIAVAAGNNSEEIEIFKNHFHVPFPIIPDLHYEMHSAIGGSPTPFTIVVKKVSHSKPMVVAYTHLGYDEHYHELLKKMQGFIRMGIKSLIKEGEGTIPTVVVLKPPLSEEELESKVKMAFEEVGGPLTGFGKVALSRGRKIYTGDVIRDGKEYHLFAQAISEVPACDVCHAFHFIYTFDSTGKILQFIPLSIFKKNNLPWDNADIDKMRKRIVGRYLFDPFSFDRRVDAVTSATITSAGIVKSLEGGQIIFKELKEKGMI